MQGTHTTPSVIMSRYNIHQYNNVNGWGNGQRNVDDGESPLKARNPQGESGEL